MRPSARLSLLLSTLVLAGGLLAGCSSSDGPGTEGIAQPTALARGDSFRYHVDSHEAAVEAYGAIDYTTGAAVVAEVTEDSYRLAAAELAESKIEAAYGDFLLGTLSKADLSGTWVIEGAWGFYQFPMAVGGTWTRDVEHFYVPEERALTFTATGSAVVDSPLGPTDAMLIEGRDADGRLQVRTDYAPAVGLYTRMEWFSLSWEEAPQGSPVLTLTLVERGSGWHGTLYTQSADNLVSMSGGTGGNGNFVVPEGATWLYGQVGAQSDGPGVAAVALAGPDGRILVGRAADTKAHGTGFAFDEPAIAGRWDFVHLSASQQPVSYAELYALTQSEDVL